MFRSGAVCYVGGCYVGGCYVGGCLGAARSRGCSGAITETASELLGGCCCALAAPLDLLLPARWLRRSSRDFDVLSWSGFAISSLTAPGRACVEVPGHTALARRTSPNRFPQQFNVAAGQNESGGGIGQGSFQILKAMSCLRFGLCGASRPERNPQAGLLLLQLQPRAAGVMIASGTRSKATNRMGLPHFYFWFLEAPSLLQAHPSPARARMRI